MKYYKLDRDTKAYLKRMALDGIKTPPDIYSVNDFVVGLKDLNLWENAIFWPLRSTQNAGIGTKAYSLSNLGIYDGTLGGSVIPRWDGNGVFFRDASNTYITTNLIQEYNENINIFAIVECNPYITEPHVICSTRKVSTNTGFTCAQDWYAQGANTIIWSTVVATDVVANISRITNGSFNAYFHRISISNPTKTAGISLNAGAQTTTNGNIDHAYSFSGLVIGAQHTSGSESLGGRIAMLAYFKTPNIQNSLIYNLYKSTAGKGLGLP
jgi:hypothetical protein